jgi:hypothetical protein
MYSGTWTIILQADDHDFQVIREFTVTVQEVERLTTTVTPTVVVGVTSTAPGISMFSLSVFFFFFSLFHARIMLSASLCAIPVGAGGVLLCVFCWRGPMLPPFIWTHPNAPYSQPYPTQPKPLK